MERIREKPDCILCRKMYDRKNEDPPCDECLPPILYANRDAFEIWQKIRRQFIMGFGGPIDVNHLAIWRMIDERQITNRMACFDKVCHAANVELEAMAADRKLEKDGKSSA